MAVVTLYPPLGQKELDLIRASGWKRFPPRLAEQPIFYPVMNLVYARQITREWNVPAKGIGHVVRFDVDADHLKRFTVQYVGAAIHDELWIPTEQLEGFNDRSQYPYEELEQRFAKIRAGAAAQGK